MTVLLINNRARVCIHKIAERAPGARSVPPAAFGVSSANAVDAIRDSRIQRVMNDAIILFFTRLPPQMTCLLHVPCMYC